MNSIMLTTGNNMQEEVSEARFATLENEVKHITIDVSEIKDSAKLTSVAIQSIDKSITIMTEHVQQNKKMGPRLEALESRADKVDKKMAAYAGGIAAISFIVLKFDKIKAFFG